MKTFATASIFAALAVSSFAFAPNLAGSWKGKMTMDMSALKKQMAGQMAKMPAEQKKQAERQMAMAESMFKTMVFDLNMKADGTYTMKNPMAGQGKGSNDTGKWKLSGSTVTMIDDKPKAGAPKELKGKVSANGKTIVVDLTSLARAEAAKRGEKNAQVPAMTLTFTKS